MGRFINAVTICLLTGLGLMCTSCFETDVRLYVEVDDSCSACCVDQRFVVRVGGQVETSLYPGDKARVERTTGTGDEALEIRIVDDGQIPKSTPANCQACIRTPINDSGGALPSGSVLAKYNKDISFSDEDLYTEVHCENEDGTVATDSDPYEHLPDWVDMTANLQDRASSLRIEVDDNIPYVAFTDMSRGKRITVKKYNNGEWEQLGSAGFSETEATNVGVRDCLNLAISNGTPYAGLCHDGLWDNAYGYVYRYNGDGSWTNLSFHQATDPAFYEISEFDMIASDDTVYVSLHDRTKYYAILSYTNRWDILSGKTRNVDGHGPMLAMADGTLHFAQVKDDRVNIGYYDEAGDSFQYTTSNYRVHNGLSVSTVNMVSANGQLYLLIHECKIPTPSVLTVMTLVNGNWEVVGTPGFGKPDWFNDPRLAVGPNGKPVVVFIEEDAKYPSVWAYDGAAWGPAGHPTTLPSGINQVAFADIAVGEDGTLYVAIIDEGASRKLIVKSLTGF